jgi:hypothetical protein
MCYARQEYVVGETIALTGMPNVVGEFEREPAR